MSKIRHPLKNQQRWGEMQIRSAIKKAIIEDLPVAKGDIDDWNYDVVANWTMAHLKTVAASEEQK